MCVWGGGGTYYNCSYEGSRAGFLVENGRGEEINNDQLTGYKCVVSE